MRTEINSISFHVNGFAEITGKVKLSAIKSGDQIQFEYQLPKGLSSEAFVNFKEHNRNKIRAFKAEVERDNLINDFDIDNLKPVKNGKRKS